MIEIIALTYDNAPIAKPMSARFDHAGGTIGRSEDNHFVLADPKHHVSRLQASVLSDGIRHQITNLSQANPTVLNGVELDCDKPCRLRVDDEIRIGTYLLRVQHAGTTTPAAQPLRAAPACVSEGPIGSAAEQATPVAASVTSRTPEIPADAHALLQAFLSGAGIASVTLSSGMTPELMHMIGEVLATAVDGTVDLLNMRALVKREANADVTMVVVRNNNPLKFLPDGAAVLTQMLRKRMPGFMAPAEAMRDAYDDLHAHQLGLFAGMRSSMQAQHRELDPARVEATPDGLSRLDWLLPANRKARLWDRYRALHSALVVPKEGQIAAGPVFLAAYERASEQYRDEAANER